jgi:hypothetical protein
MRPPFVQPLVSQGISFSSVVFAIIPDSAEFLGLDCYAGRRRFVATPKDSKLAQPVEQERERL